MTFLQMLAGLWLAGLITALLLSDRVIRPRALRWSWILLFAFVVLGYGFLMDVISSQDYFDLRPLIGMLQKWTLLAGLLALVVSLWPIRWPGRLPRQQRMRPSNQIAQAMRRLEQKGGLAPPGQAEALGVMRAIQARFSVRAYQDRPVESDKLLAVLEAGRLAPSAKNRQPWRFVVVQDSQTRQKLVGPCNGQAFVAQAPAVIAAVGLLPDRIMDCQVPGDPVDVAIAVDHMTLAAVELGLGTCWVGKFDQDQVRRLLHIPNDVKIIELLTLGYPAEPPRTKVRKVMDEIVCWEQWQ